jgi:tetratricopeptide (TPR) repeat protein
MSLINQMLKDLARRSKPLPDPEVILSGLVSTPYSKPKKNKFHYWLIASSSLFTLMVTSVIFQQEFSSKYHQNRIILATFNSQLHPISKTGLKINEMSTLPLNPVMLTGMTLQIQNEMTNFRFLLSQNTLYRITTNGKDRLVIVLENARLIANLPQIDTTNSAIKSIRMTTQADGSLKIILILNTGAELSHLELNEAGKLSELQMDLSYIDGTLPNPQQGDVVEEQQINPIKKITYDTSIADEYQQAMNFSTQGQNNEAIALLTKFLIKHPEFVPARKSLTTLLLNEGNTSKAQQVINAGLQQQPLFAPYIQLKAQILVNKGKIRQALNLLQLAPPPLEENPEYHAFIAALYQRQNKAMLAEKLYEALLNQQPDNSIWWMGLGIARESLNKNQEALAAYKKANNTNNLSPELKVYVETRIHALL